MLLIIFIVAIGISIAFRLFFELSRIICVAIILAFGWRFFCVSCSIVLCTFCVIIISIGCLLFIIATLVAICLCTKNINWNAFKYAEKLIFRNLLLPVPHLCLMIAIRCVLVLLEFSAYHHSRKHIRLDLHRRRWLPIYQTKCEKSDEIFVNNSNFIFIYFLLAMEITNNWIPYHFNCSFVYAVDSNVLHVANLSWSTFLLIHMPLVSWRFSSVFYLIQYKMTVITFCNRSTNAILIPVVSSPRFSSSAFRSQTLRSVIFLPTQSDDIFLSILMLLLLLLLYSIKPGLHEKKIWIEIHLTPKVMWCDFVVKSFLPLRLIVWNANKNRTIVVLLFSSC